MQWNLHLVGESLETDLEEVLAKLVTELEDIGHRLTSATLTTDAGQKQIGVTTPPVDPPQSVGGEPVTPAPTDTSPAAPVESTEPPVVSTSPSSDPTTPVDDTSTVSTDTPPTL